MSQAPASFSAVTPYRPSDAGRSLMVNDKHRQILDGLREISQESSSRGYHAKAVTSAVDGLRGCAFPVNSYLKDGNPNRRCIVYPDFEIEFEVGSYYGGPQTDVSIVDIRIFRSETKTNTRAALWNVTHTENESGSEWKRSRDPESQLKPTPKCSGTENDSIKIGINGFCKNIDHAISMLPSHITRGNETSLGKLKSSGYQLFYIPQSNSYFRAGWSFVRDLGRTSPSDLKSSQILASHMREAHENGLFIEWTSHRGGSKPLTQAMKLLAKQGVNVAGKQKVFLSDHTSSHFEADRARRAIGMNTTDSKWHNSTKGIAQLVGGQIFGGASLACSINELINHTKREELGGKIAVIGSTAIGGGIAINSTYEKIGKLIAEHGVSPALALSVLSVIGKTAIVGVAAASIPSLNENYHNGPQDPIKNLGNKIGKKLIPQG
ncbi:hypothetical protein M0G74_04360 [Microbulbifer sp. CAU 1566]|uniref:hypothetical protein n=1 Tax=Microbulbifer sp. CAU 1566 TaxID=2933269 RepID=UPI002005CA4A|nr:hypothetical protein [Microbulbifer sp. CAU 1566]MCK7596503.1 hypothetical protein [Microbulbifer sp. CAU 1566]